MKRIIYKALSIEEGEGLSVFLLIIQSFFIGVFSQSFEISATALFMESYGKSMIGTAYLFSGIVGIVLTAIYSGLQSRIKFSALAIINLLFITLTTAFMWYGFEVSQDKRLIFVAFLMMGPLFILSLVGFSGMVGRLYTLRQGKRLFSIVDSGLIFGILVISFLIPFLLPIIPATKDLILIAAGSILISLFLQVIISFTFNLNKAATSEEEDKSSKGAGVKIFLSNKYVRLMSLFVMLTMVAAFFVTYSFLAVTKINYPETKEFAGFLGKFMFAVMAFSFVIKTFIYSKLMKTYGLKVNLMILPALLLFFVVITALAGTFLGYEEGSSTFLIYFLLTALVRFFAINLKDSIQTPSLKLLFQPLDKNIRYDIQAKVEGVINELSAVLAGGLLAALALLPFFESIHYSYSLIIIVGAWLYITMLLYKEYQNTLRQSLISYRNSDVKDQEQEDSVFMGSEESRIIYTLELTRMIDPVSFDQSITDLMSSSNVNLQNYALNNIEQNSLLNAQRQVEELSNRSRNKEIKEKAIDINKKLIEIIEKKSDLEEVTRLSKSKEKTDRQQAAKIISTKNEEALTPVLKTLIKDIDPGVKISAIKATANTAYKDLWQILIDYLENHYYASTARRALINIGEPALFLLEKSFLKSGISSETMVTLTGIISEIEGDRATEFLLDKISFTDRNVVLEALEGLSKRNYEADEQNVRKLIQAIEINIGIAAWNLSILHDLSEAEYDNQLTRAMVRERDKSFNLLFTMLSVAYDKSSIQHIRENIESGTTESISFAIEMLDLFVDEQLKTTLFALLEDNKLEDKIRELELHFPIYRHDRVGVLNQIMNRSSNYVSQFTKACAIYTLLENDDAKVTDDLVANLFNPDPVLRETAAIVLNTLDHKKYVSCSSRLDEDLKFEADRSISQIRKIQPKSKDRKGIPSKRINRFCPIKKPYLIGHGYDHGNEGIT